MEEIVAKIQNFGTRVKENVEKVIVGKSDAVELAIVALLCEGHILIEDIPGIGKTVLAKSLARSLGCTFHRIQCTPDLLPSDITGTYIFNQKTGDFDFRAGPIMAQVVLTDEINRATPRTQSALLEAMQERQVTVGRTTYDLPDPFFTIATQNPIEQEGTYPLPEAQVDRFMFKLLVDYPAPPDERLMLDRMTNPIKPTVRPVVQPEQILAARQLVREVYMDDRIKDYVLNLVTTTRRPGDRGLKALQPLIAYGASPRAGIYLIEAARARAFLHGRGYVIPDDVKELAPEVLRHRIITTYEAEAENITSAQIVQQILQRVEVP